MRFSFPALTRICDDEGNYLLILNQGRLERLNIRVYAPVGGALEATDRSYLTDNFGAIFENGNDLRLRVANKYVKEVIAWFKSRTYRETSSLREVYEELIEETKLLKRADLRGMRERYVVTVRHDEETVRDVPEKQTIYLIEVYEVELPAGAMAKLKAAAQKSDPDVYFATEEEIRRGETNDGTKIGNITAKILPR